jgi:hypothetical protein
MDGTKGTSLRQSLSSSGIKLSITTIAAVCLAMLILTLEVGHKGYSSGTDTMHLFQSTVGGLGMGAAVAPAWNLLHFDPRLQPVDDSNLWPVAGSYPYSPTAVSTAVALRELPREDLRIIGIEQ